MLRSIYHNYISTHTRACLCRELLQSRQQNNNRFKLIQQDWVCGTPEGIE